MLHFLEADGFFVKNNGEITQKSFRNKRIENLVKISKWHPEKLLERDVIFDKRNDNEYTITGTAYSSSININFEEKWIIEKDRWRISYLIIHTT